MHLTREQLNDLTASISGTLKSALPENMGFVLLLAQKPSSTEGKTDVAVTSNIGEAATYMLMAQVSQNHAAMKLKELGIDATDLLGVDGEIVKQMAPTIEKMVEKIKETKASGEKRYFNTRAKE